MGGGGKGDAFFRLTEEHTVRRLACSDGARVMHESLIWSGCRGVWMRCSNRRAGMIYRDRTGKRTSDTHVLGYLRELRACGLVDVRGSGRKQEITCITHLDTSTQEVALPSGYLYPKGSETSTQEVEGTSTQEVAPIEKERKREKGGSAPAPCPTSPQGAEPGAPPRGMTLDEYLQSASEDERKKAAGVLPMLRAMDGGK